MAPDSTPKYSDADVDRIVAKRLTEAQQANVVEALSKELTAIRREIASANHIKRTLGKQIAELATLVRGHLALPMHAGTAEKFTQLERNFQEAEQEFGLDNLTPEERAAFPTVVRTVLAGQKRVNDKAREDQAHAEEDSRFWQKVAAIAGAISVLMGFLYASGAFTFLRVVVFHLKP